jgi:hypothetical protein
MEASLGERIREAWHFTYIPGQTGQIVAVAAVLQQSLATLHSQIGHPQIGQSGQHDSLAICAVAQHAPSGQQVPSGQQEDATELSELDSEKAATVPVTANAKAMTPLAMIFAIMIFLQLFEC